MELQDYCEKLSYYYGLFVNEVNKEVSDHLLCIIKFYYQKIGNCLKGEDDFERFLSDL